MLFLLTAVMLLTFSGSVLAFSDVKNVPGGEKIDALQKEGIVSGEPGGKFDPSGKLTNAAGVSLLVKGLDLSLARFLFIKAPVASDYFTEVPDGKWYSEAFVIAKVNDVELPENIKPEATMTREQFAYYLFQAVEANGQHAYTLKYNTITDGADLNPAYDNGIQNLLNASVIHLDKNGALHPKAVITRGEAAVWVHDARKFVKEAEALPPVMEAPQITYTDWKVTVKEAAKGVQEVTVTANAPHPGYGLRIASIAFDGDKAVLYTEYVQPDPDKIYIQVITEVKAVTYVSSEYKVVLPELENTAVTE